MSKANNSKTFTTSAALTVSLWCLCCLWCISMARGMPQIPFRGSSPGFAPPGSYQLPADAGLILLAPVKPSFSCEGLPYGYYADVPNNCQIFHICLPIQDDQGAVIETAQWSFVCGNTTIFDQSTLTCNFPENAFPCNEAPNLYGAVEFGKIDQ